MSDQTSTKKMLPPNYWNRVSEIRIAQNFKEFYSRFFSGYMSIYLTAALSYTKITPNMVTFTMFFWGILGGLLFSIGDPIYYLLGSLSLMMLNVADAADGELARYTGAVSNGGDYLDRVAHYVTNAAAIIGMGVGLYLQYGELWILGFAIAVEIAHTSDDAARDLLVTCGLADNIKDGERKKEKLKTKAINSMKLARIGQIIGTNMAFFHLTALCALIDIIFFEHEETGLTIVYFLLFGLITIAKLCVRIYRIKNLYFI